MRGNWAQEKGEQQQAADKLLSSMKKMEQRHVKDGWRWYALNAKTKILVPFDTKGNPTKEGLEMIRINKEKLESLD